MKNLIPYAKIIRSGLLLCLAILLFIIVWHTFQHFLKTTESGGLILVDSPEVYTRERLVNDRFTQSAWLEGRLGRANEDHPVEIMEIQRKRKALTVGASMHVKKTNEKGDGDEPVDKSASNINKESIEKSIDRETEKDIFTQNLGYSLIDEFRDDLEYRNEIRTELMQSQLDDRHDIQGNTLYRLNFDSTILPGKNEDGWAVIEVVLEKNDCNIRSIYNEIYRSSPEAIKSKLNPIDLCRNEGKSKNTTI